MKRLFYLLFGLVLLPALLYAQGTLSLKDINDNLTNNYYTKTVSDSKYGTTASVALKADKTYVDANFATTAENALKQNIADMVDYYTKTAADLLLADKADTDSVYTKTAADILLGLKADLTYVNATDEAILLGNDSQDVTIESNRVGVASLEVGLQTHQNKATGAHAATAISATWTNVQVSLDSIEAAIQGIVVGSGFALESWVNSTLETNFYTKAQTNATIEAAIAAIPTPSVNQTILVEAGEDLSAGDVVSLINSGGTMKAYNNALTVSTSPNGAESVFNSATTAYCKAVKLDTTRFIIIYRDSDTYAHAIVGTVSGSSISYGSETAAFENTDSSFIAAALVATDKVLVAYQNEAGNCRAVVLSISTNTITVGTPMSVHTGGGSAYQSMDVLETDKAILCYRYAGNKGYAVILTVSNTTPSAGTPVEFDTDTPYISVSSLSSTSAIVAYQDVGNSLYGTAQVLSISGTTITPGTERVFKEAATYYPAVVGMASDKAVIIYRASSLGYGVVASISGTTITYGAESASFTGDTSYNSIAKIDNTRVIIAAQLGNTHYGQSTIGNVGSSTITFDTSRTYNAANSTYNSVCYLGSNKSVIVYQDAGNSSYGTAVVNEWATSSYASISGISSGAYSSGSDAVVLISGVSDDQSGLITGSPYFLQSDFTIGTTPVSLAKYYNSSTATGEIKIGTAKSATELIIGIDFK